MSLDKMIGDKKIMDNGTSGGSLLTLLGILFIGLKLTKYIDWSWWFVLLPIYIGPLIALVILSVFGIVMILMWLLE